MRAANLTLVSEDGDTLLDGVSFAVDLPSRIAVVGPAGSGKEELTVVLANLIDPDGGRVLIDDQDLHKLPEAVTGRQMTYVGYPAQIFAGTIAENLLFGLKHRPVEAPQLEGASIEAHKRELYETERAGNSPYDFEAEWIDYATLGLSGPEDIVPAAVRVLGMVQLDRDVYQLGLRGTIDPELRPEVAESILKARVAMGERLQDAKLGRLVEIFDPERYNGNATLAENLLFGTPIGPTFEPEHLAAHPYVREVIAGAELTDALVEAGLKLASTMVELFADLPPDHEYFRQFSFISADDLPDYRALVSRVDPAQLDTLSQADRERLISITFKLIPARHRLDLLDDALKGRVLEARRLFRERLPEELAGAISFFEAGQYTTGASLQDNILFGKVAYGQAQATDRISDLIAEVLEALGLRERVIEVGLEAQAGVGGARLSLPQRQKLALARALLKRPEVLVAYDALGPLDPAEQTATLDALLEEFADRTLIWALNRTDWAEKFDQVLVMRNGQVAQQGRYQELFGDGGALQELTAAE